MTTPHPFDAAGAPDPGPSPAPTRPAGRARTLLAALGLAVVVALTGLPLGWLWAELSPRVQAIRTDEGLAYAEAAPEQAVAADGWFVILGGAAGVLVAVLAWMILRRQRGVTVLLALTLGCLAAGYIAWLVGRAIGQAEFEQIAAAAVGSVVQAPLKLRVTGLDIAAWWRPVLTGVAAAQPLMAAVTYTTLAAFSARPGLRPEPPAGPPVTPYGTDPGPDPYSPNPYPYSPNPHTPNPHTQPGSGL